MIYIFVFRTWDFKLTQSSSPMEKAGFFVDFKRSSPSHMQKSRVESLMIICEIMKLCFTFLFITKNMGQKPILPYTSIMET